VCSLDYFVIIAGWGARGAGGGPVPRVSLGDLSVGHIRIDSELFTTTFIGNSLK
tara:strand:- start:670 stop:831 length:162 start_codon:yes stop_codon:yes gene_type:complete